MPFENIFLQTLGVTTAAKSGAATKSRTRDLLITNQLLYQLSYSGENVKKQQVKADFVIGQTAQSQERGGL